MYLTLEEAKQVVLREKYHGVTSKAYQADCARLEKHEPYEYILGYADFLGCRIDLSRRPMVPRDKTAYWVERVLHEWSDKSPRTALDLYAGSGNIGIALLKHLSTLHTTFSEVDASLLSGIQASLTVNQIDPTRATLMAGDSLAPIHERFDILCANPPYLDPALEADMDPEMLHEPRVAFFGSSDGYLHHRELIEHGRDYLTPHGVLYVECDMTQEDTLTNLVKKSDWQYEFWNDEFGNPGTLVLRQ